MAVFKKTFYYHEKSGSHNEDWYSLARDEATGKVFIIHEWAHGFDVGEAPMEIREFLAGTTSAQSRFYTLIGTLAQELHDGDRS